jgi:hypothetical protein
MDCGEITKQQSTLWTALCRSHSLTLMLFESTGQFRRKTQKNNYNYSNLYYYTKTCNTEYMVLFITHSLIISLRHEEAWRSGERTPHIPASELHVVYPLVS